MTGCDPEEGSENPAGISGPSEGADHSDRSDQEKKNDILTFPSFIRNTACVFTLLGLVRCGVV